MLIVLVELYDTATDDHGETFCVLDVGLVISSSKNVITFFF